MEEKERYSYDYFIDGAVFIDTENDRDMDMDTVCSLLNKQDKCIKELEEENKQLKQQLEEKEKEVETLKAKLETAEYWNKKYDDCQQQLALTEKALKLAREYMFNVMCADDVPFESWFIECAKNDWKPS